jgi:DNA-binding winged helix-turn-helix (wHTH) protein
LGCTTLGNPDYRVTRCTLPEREKNGNAHGVNDWWTGGEHRLAMSRSERLAGTETRQILVYFRQLLGRGMSSPGNENGTFRFGEFAVDPRAGEVYRRGKKVKLQPQPVQVLLALLEKPRQIVTREELRQRIWPADTFVDFEHSLNTAIKKLRLALGDRANKSKFVETLPRRGYRFLPSVEAVEEKPVVRTAGSRLEGKVFILVSTEGSACVLAPVDGKAFEEWRRLTGLNDDVGVSMMITEKRLLLLEAGMSVRLLARDVSTGWREVRILEGEHYGKTALIGRKSLREAKRKSSAS